MKLDRLEIHESLYFFLESMSPGFAAFNLNEFGKYLDLSQTYSYSHPPDTGQA